MSTTTIHTGILRCTQPLCVAFINYHYRSAAEKQQVLTANSLRPWRCPTHGGGS